MKKIYLLFSLLVMAVLNASAQFITVWKTDNPGIFNNSSITIPATGNQYSIAWEEVGNPANNGTATGSGTRVLSFPSPGTYQVSISPGSGTFSRIAFANSGDRNKLLEIKQWGDIRWTSMENAFQGCTNLTISATDAPDLQGVTSLATGRKVLQITLISEKTTIPLSGLPGGVYLIRSDEGWQGKFVKK